MSLIIAAKCRDGIVLGCDTRTTIRNSKGIRYSDTTVKIVPFPNRCCVAFCGNNSVKKSVTVHQFLTEFRDAEGDKLTISSLPTELLAAVRPFADNKDITFLICGYSAKAFDGRIYRLDTKNFSVSEELGAGGYGATYNGITDICHHIMGSGIDFSNMTAFECEELVRVALVATVSTAKFWDVQGVGGDICIYTLHHYDDRKIGWCKDGMYVPEDGAAIDALEQLRKAQIEQMIAAEHEEKAGGAQDA